MNGRRARAILRVVFLTWLAATATVLACWPVAENMSAGMVQTRTYTWTWVAGEFTGDVNAYTSPVTRAAFPFTAAAVHVKPFGTEPFSASVELRLRADGGDWSPWYTIEEFEPEVDGRWYGENLVAWPQAREAQVGIHAASPLDEVLSDLTIVAIDASDGPTVYQAALSARTRTAVKAAMAEDDPGVPKPTVISREEWGANESWMTWPPSYAPVNKMILHHTVSGGGTDPAAEVRSIYYYHAISRGWGDIGYNFLVDRFGNIYEGRYGGTDVIGAHAAYWNEGSLGMSVLGCYDNRACSSPQVPTADTLGALADLVAWTSSRRTIDPRELREFSNGYTVVTNYVWAGHRDYGSTVCPGGNLYAELPNLRQMAWERLPEYDVRFGWHNTPSELMGGERVTVYPELYNYGRLLWSDGAGVRLGYRWIKDGQVVAENTDAARIIAGAEVNFGEMTSLVAQLTGPTVPGTLTLRWDLYRDGVGWFADQPAPSGRSQPLELTVEVAPALALDVELYPAAVGAGASSRVRINVQGPEGQVFETRTDLPSEVSYVDGSAQNDVGSVYLDSGDVVWSGSLNASAAQASFDVRVSSGVSGPLALPITTTYNVEGFSTLSFTSWVIVDGYHSYMPLVVKAWAE